MVKRAFLALSLTILTPLLGFAGSIGINQFSGLDSQDNPSALQSNQSPDLLNVRLQPGGRSVYKRDGYGLFSSLNSVSTATVHGGYHFQQSGGSDVQLWGSDNGIFASVNDASFVKVASGTVGATWQCTDNLGFAYCLTSSMDTPVKTDGSSANTTYVGTIPAGSIIASTPLQLAVAGVSGNASSIYVSANNNFSSFTTGPLATDSYIEIINAPGSRITHMGYYFGNLYWWKDSSFGYISGSASQGTVGITIISNQVGTLDNSSAFWNPTTYDQGNKFNSGAQTVSAGNPYFNEMSSLGGIFFRGQDNHVYQYDGYTLTRLSRIITPNVTSSSRRKANSWTQSTQADFSAGAIVPSVNLSTSISPGDVIVSSFQAVENSSTQWTSGTASNLTVSPSSITLNTNDNGTVDNSDFESALSGNWFPTNIRVTSEPGLGCGTINPQSGSNFVVVSAASGFSSWAVELIDISSNIVATQSIALANDCSWRQISFSPPQSTIGRRLYLRFHIVGNITSYATTQNPYIIGGPLTFYAASGTAGSPTFSSFGCIDNVSGGTSTITSGAFTSKVYDTGFTSATYTLQSAFTVNTSTPSFSLQTSTASNGVFTALETSTGSNAIGNRYSKYSSTISIGSTDNALSYLSSITILARSTGTYYSTVDNAASLSSWGSFTANDVYLGISSITYYTRASTNSFSVLSSTPAWVAQAKNATVAASTGTYMQMRGDFYLSAATETPTLNDFTFNWFEGTAGDKAYINYFQDAIWFSVSSGSGTSTNNTIFYLDLLNNTWLKDDIASNGFAVENNALYIGSPLTASIYKFGGVTTDNGLPIHSYWKSMDFTGQDPTVQNDYDQADFAFAESSTSVTFTYIVDQSTSITKSKSISLYSPRNTILKRGFALEKSTIGTYYNFKVEDNSSLSPWTLMGQRTTYNPLPWRPQESN